MKKFKIKTGDTVKVIAGTSKNSEGKVLQIIKDKDRVLVEGVNLVSKHTTLWTLSTWFGMFRN